MPKLILCRAKEKREIFFEGTPLLSQVFLEHGIVQPHPCGGGGVCGKCAVRVFGLVSPENDMEKKAGTRLSCQVRLLGDCEVLLPEAAGEPQITLGGVGSVAPLRPVQGRYGAAIDIGTTTLAAGLYDLQSGSLLGQAGSVNPQTAVAADVMGRIGAALEGAGPRLQAMLLAAFEALLEGLCKEAGIGFAQIDALVIAGNTTMLYLLTGRNPEPLAHAPFEAACLFGGWAEILGKRAYLAPCVSAFVGGDITCALMACGMCESPETALLADVGTNGEIALWHEGKLSVTSTAAGPAFEGGGIHMGCGSVPGAIDRVWLEDGALRCHALGGAEPCGVCGSGLMDGVAALLAQGRIEETGFTPEDRLHLSEKVYLIPRDIRNVQLAKGAIAAGIKTLMEEDFVPLDKVARFYVAGGFGSHLNFQSAVSVGLFPKELSGRAQVCGNAALAGASMLLLDETRMEKAADLAKQAEHKALSGNPRFAKYYMEEMMFPTSSNE